MERLELTVSVFIRLQSLTNQLYGGLLDRLREDIDHLGQLDNDDRVHIIGILG